MLSNYIYIHTHIYTHTHTRDCCRTVFSVKSAFWDFIIYCFDLKLFKLFTHSNYWEILPLMQLPNSSSAVMTFNHFSQMIHERKKKVNYFSLTTTLQQRHLQIILPIILGSSPNCNMSFCVYAWHPFPFSSNI